MSTCVSCLRESVHVSGECLFGLLNFIQRYVLGVRAQDVCAAEGGCEDGARVSVLRAKIINS